jgi:beta-fructofuranosidase
LTPDPTHSRQQFSNDPHRPTYHFLAPANWLNDPNGLIQWRGQYHLFYQYNPYSPWHHQIHWGHAVSDDLVHWRDLPVALEPTPHGPDSDGCWSGCAVDNDGVPTLFYSGVQPQVVCMATSDDNLNTWHKYEHNPIIGRIPDSVDSGDPWDFRDPFVWQEDGIWYMLMGSRILNAGGAVLLFRSENLIDWEYINPLLVGNRNQLEPFWTGTVWECPNLVKIGNYHVLILSYQHHETGQLLYCGYYTGEFKDHAFTPQAQAILDYGGFFYAPQVMKDSQNRHLIWGWLQEGRSEVEQKKAGWAGCLSLPRLLEMGQDGQLIVKPAPELTALRGEHTHFNNLEITADSANFLHSVKGDCLEIKAEIEPDTAEQFGLKVRCAPDGSEESWLLFDLTQQLITLEIENSSLDHAVYHDVLPAQQVVRSAPFAVDPEQPILLHVFLDKSVIEIFINERVTFSSRIYPTRADSLGLAFFTENGRIQITSADIWQVKSIWG